jgi:transposase InsO family protein
MSSICAWYGLSRQAHYQQVERDGQANQTEAVVIKLVLGLRQRHPRMGGRKLRHELQPALAQAGIHLGRDRFFDLLARHDLLLSVARQRRRTTWPGGWRCPNRLENLLIARVQQVWVCDITYLETQDDGFCYLCLITDAFSRFIVGFDVSTSLAVEGALRALDMAIAQARPPLAGLIHHSDHGIQYTCHAYRDRLAQVACLSSMGQVGNCYDNPQAERVNGILKLEYGLGDPLPDMAHATTATAQAVWLYNHERPHLALRYQKPAEVHRKLRES